MDLPLRRFPFILIICEIVFSLSASSQLNYWQQRTSAVGFNVGINPLNPYTIYCERSSGVLSVSRDKGYHWTDLPTSPPIVGIRHILVHPRDTLTIFAVEFFNNGLWKTTNEGLTWTDVLPNYGIDGESMDYDPAHSDTMYAGKFSDGSVYRSTNRGDTWTLQGISGPHLCGLIVRPDSANILYAGTGASRISKTTDAGVTWTIVNDGGAEEVPKFAINPQNPLVGYATTYGEPDSLNNLWKTTDGGETWFKTPLQKIAIWSLAIDVQHPETLYVGEFGTTRGIDRTTDGGLTFQHFEDGLLTNFAAWNLRVHPLDPSSVYLAGTHDFFGVGGVFQFIDSVRSSIHGSKFRDVNGNGVRDTADHALSGWKIYLGGDVVDTTVTDLLGNYVFPSLPAGSYTVSEESRPGWVQSFPASAYTIVLPQGRDTVGFDFGNFGLPRDTVSPGWNMVSLPVVPPDYRKAVLFPSAVSSAFAFSGSYAPRDTMENGSGFWLKFSSPETLLVTGAPKPVDSINVRHGWNMVGSVASPTSVSSISSIPGGIVTSQFYGYSGSYYIANSLVPGKAYWVKVNQAGVLILGGSSPASSRIAISLISEIPPPAPSPSLSPTTALPTSYSLGQNYPDPFNPSTTIAYQLPASGFVSLKVYNMVGQVVAVLKGGPEDAGYKSVQWDASAFPSGVYLYELKASTSSGSGFSQVRKLVLLK